MKCHFYGNKLLVGFFKSWFHYVVLARRFFSFFFSLILAYKMPSCQTPKFLLVCFSAPKLPVHHSVCPWLVHLPQSSTWHHCPENESFQVHQRYLLKNSFTCSFCLFSSPPARGLLLQLQTSLPLRVLSSAPSFSWSVHMRKISLILSCSWRIQSSRL